MATIPSRLPLLSGSFSGFRRGHERPQPRSLLLAVIGLLMRWQERAEERYALAELDDRLLRDIGLDRIAAAREARKPFWQA